MDGPSLLKALMDAAGDNAYAVASSLRKPALQSYIWKFVNGKAKEPRRSSLQPLADRYRVPVDAFYDAALAERLAIERGLVAGKSAAGSVPEQGRPEPDQIGAALRVLADALRGADKVTRSAVAPLFSLLALEPEQLENVADTVKKLVTAPPQVARDSHDEHSTGTTFKGLGTGALLPNEQRIQIHARQGKK